MYGQTNNDYVYYRQVPTMVPYDNTNEAGGGWGKHPAGGYYEGPNHVATLMSHHANERRFGPGQMRFWIGRLSMI